MRVARSRTVAPCAIAIALLLTANRGHASTGYEFPENGTEQLGRAGAWVARASNPLATFFNPAGLAGQPSGVLLNSALIWQKNCLKRTYPDGQPVRLGNGGAYQYPDEVCNSDSGTPFPNPQFAAVLQLSDRLGLGFAVLGPSTRGKFEFPSRVTGSRVGGVEREVPSPQRYLLQSDELLFVWPQIGVGWEPVDDLRFGASLIWGIARLQFSVIAAGRSGGETIQDYPYPAEQYLDFQADLDVKDLFVPGFTVGSLWSPTRNIDVAAWYHWMDDIRGKGDMTVRGSVYGDPPHQPPASQNSVSTSGDAVEVVAPWPMQARVGFRWHQPRDGVVSKVRDPLANDEWDIELDLTWANNSQFKQLDASLPPGVFMEVQNPADPNPDASVGFAMPTNASVPHHWKDAFGIRLGGDYVLLPGQFALRGGAFFQTEAQDPKYLHVDYIPSQMFGLHAGGTVRFGSLDLMVAYAHVFFKGLDNGGEGETLGLTGSAPTYRTEYPVNGGSNSSVVNAVSLGAGYTF